MNKPSSYWILPVLAGLLLVTGARAHELRPAYLEIDASADDSYSVLWKVPRSSSSNALLELDLRLPAECRDSMSPRSNEVGSGLVTRRVVTCDGSLVGKEVAVLGLAEANSKVLVRISLDGDETRQVILTADDPAYVLEGEPSALRIAWDYVVLGVEHILLGIDHLLFVLALLLLISGVGTLIKAITAFTIAHSVTLTMATLGFVGLPGPPVEAVIALSIVFLATELAQRHKGRQGLAQRRPWLVAFSFGLLHGFGFAGALSEVGLPQSEVPIALLAFNVGVELGQLMFVAVVLAFMAVLRGVRIPMPFWLRQAPAYMIGTMAMFWCVERTLGFW